MPVPALSPMSCPTSDIVSIRSIPSNESSMPHVCPSQLGPYSNASWLTPISTFWDVMTTWRNAALRAEKAALGTTYGDQAWYPDQLLFLQRHQYFTQIAATQRGLGKRRNLRQMQAIVADCCPDSLRVQAALPVASTATP